MKKKPWFHPFVGKPDTLGNNALPLTADLPVTGTIKKATIDKDGHLVWETPTTCWHNGVKFKSDQLPITDLDITTGVATYEYVDNNGGVVKVWVHNGAIAHVWVDGVKFSPGGGVTITNTTTTPKPKPKYGSVNIWPGDTVTFQVGTGGAGGGGGGSGLGFGTLTSQELPDAVDTKPMVSGSDTLTLLKKSIPNLATARATCPAEPCNQIGLPAFFYTDAHGNPMGYSLMEIIVHLNDHEMWTREQVADWLDTLDIDLQFQPSKEEA